MVAIRSRSGHDPVTIRSRSGHDTMSGRIFDTMSVRGPYKVARADDVPTCGNCCSECRMRKGSGHRHKVIGKDNKHVHYNVVECTNNECDARLWRCLNFLGKRHLDTKVHPRTMISMKRSNNAPATQNNTRIPKDISFGPLMLEPSCMPETRTSGMCDDFQNTTIDYSMFADTDASGFVYTNSFVIPQPAIPEKSFDTAAPKKQDTIDEETMYTEIYNWFSE